MLLRIYTVDGNWQETKNFRSVDEVYQNTISAIKFENTAGDLVLIPTNKISTVSEIIKENHNGRK